MDLKLASDLQSSFRIFQGRVLDEYDRLAEPYRFHVVDASRPIEDQQEEVRDAASSILQNHEVKLHGIEEAIA